MSNTLDALLSSKSAEWYTPARYIDAARLVMGRIDLDPASCAAANETIKATRYYSTADDGLTRLWAGCVWLNPPYGKQGSKSNQALWSTKLTAEYCSGHVSQALMLVNACTADRWFAPLWDFPICFTNHRIKFVSASGRRNQPTHGNAFVYFGPRVDDFARAFSAFGYVVKGGAAW